MEEQSAQPISSNLQETITPIRIPLIERYGISPVLFGFLILIVVFILYQFIGGVITYFFFGLRPTTDTIVGFRIVTGFGQIVFLLVPTLLLVRFATLTPSQYLRLAAPNPRTLIPPLIGIFSLQQMLQIYLYFQENIPLPESVRSYVDKFKTMIEEVYKLLVSSHSIPELITVIFVIALIPAIAEELLFRGLVQRSFEKGLTMTKGMILTGIIFGAYHLNPFTFIPLVILGIYLGFLTLRSNSVWVSVSAHFYNNSFACIAAYLQLDEDFIVTGKSSEMSIGILLFTFVVFGILFYLSTYYFLQVTEPPQHPTNLQS